MSAVDDDFPVEIKVRDKGQVFHIAFESGATLDIAAEYLRVMSPSAEVQGHSRKDRKIVGGKKAVAIIGVEPVGTYAVRLSFDDLHATGIFTWTYLRDLDRSYGSRWAAYLAELEEAGLSRDYAGERPSRS